ncbi:DNA-binding protein [Gammaproteobacteria bacterium]
MSSEIQSPLLTRINAAAYLGVKPSTLDNWACTGRYNLPYIKVGKLALYQIDTLNQWIERRTNKVGKAGCHV